MKDFRSIITEYSSKSPQDVLAYLFSFWGVENLGESFKLIGIYEKADKPDRNGKEYGFFKEIRSVKGDLLYYPFRLGLLNIWVEHRESLLQSNFHQINVHLDIKKNRDRNPFKLSLADNVYGKPKNIFIDRISKEKLIKRIFNETGFTDRDARNTSNALKRIAGDLYTEPERFIFELLQNADDIPNDKNEVIVKFKLLIENFLFLHTGKPFDSIDVESISSIGDSTKRKDSEKTGYKGIGFKSVFTDAETVLINSGNFSFSFDKQSALYEGKNIEETPWEIKPIWTELYRYPKEVRDCADFFRYPVAIDLEVGETKENLYKEIISNLFKEPRFILFLRNIRTIEVEGALCDIRIQKNKIGNKFELLSNGDSINHWFINDFEFEVPQLVRDLIADDKLVPEKLKGIMKSKISFACKLVDDRISSVSPESSYLFTYLPTNVNDYKFPFLVNADFLTTANRQSIHVKNPWNLYIFEQIGYLCFKWIASIVSDGEYYKSVFNLIPDKLTNPSDLIHLSFCKGFNKALVEIAFIPTQISPLERISNVLIDETGIANLLNEEFIQITGLTQKLIHHGVVDGIEKIKALIIENKIGAIYSIGNLKSDLKNEKFQTWLKVPHNNFVLINYLFHSQNASLKSLLETELIILTEAKQLSKSILLFKNIPGELTFVTLEILNKELVSLLDENNISLSLKPYEPVSFYKENILGKHIKINDTLSNYLNLLNFWRYIYDNWNLFEIEKPIFESLKNFKVLCKPKDSESDTTVIISAAYLALEFNPSNEIETIIKSLQIQNAYFISSKYIEEIRIIDKWRKIFKQAGAITDLQKVIEVLLPKLTTIGAPKHLEIAKQIFKFWKDPANTLTVAQIGLIKNNLKIRCVDNEFRKSTDCFISDHYNNNQLIASCLPNIELANQVAQEYAPRTNQVAEWKNFFALIGCVELTDKQNVFDAKIDFIITAQDVLREKHFDLLKNISDLHKNKKENGLSFDFEKGLSHIKLQTSNDEWHLPNQIHLSNIYKPKLSLQNDDAINSTLHFLSEKYIPTEIQKYFLTDIGVNDGFYFKKIIPIIQVDKVQEHKFVSQLESIEKYRLRVQEIKKMTSKDARGYSVRSYPDEKIRLNTYVTNHLLINYPQLLLIPKYSELFLKFVIKDKNIDTLSTETEIKIWNNNVYKHPNYIAWLLQTHSELENQVDEFVKPTELFSFNLDNYIANKAKLPKINYSTQIAENGKSLEEVLGIQQMLKISHCIELLCRIENKISYEEIIQLQIVEILSGYSPTDDEKSKLFLLNQNLEWKAIKELFISTDDQFQIEPTQNLHEDFYPIAECFGVQELSEENLVLKTSPKTPSVSDEIESFFGSKAKFIAFKIDHLNYEEVEAMIIEKINPIVFCEVTSIAKVFPEVSPIYKREIDFHFDEYENKILYNGNWKTNKQVIDFLFQIIQHEKIERVWFENLIIRWDDNKLIEKLNEEVGTTPPEWTTSSESKNEDGTPVPKITDSFWPGLNKEDENFIRGIIKGDYELNEQLDANTAARIKTLMKIKHEYTSSVITNEDRFLLAGEDEILVRSAQNGLLYLDLYNWGRLNKDNVRLAIYTKNEIEIYNTQDELIQFTKPQNKFGILRMPIEYGTEDYNSLDNITDKGKWHFVFIVNENTKVAQSYKEVMNLDDYNF